MRHAVSHSLLSGSRSSSLSFKIIKSYYLRSKVRKGLKEKEAERAKEMMREKKRKAAERQHGDVMRTIISEVS